MSPPTIITNERWCRMKRDYREKDVKGIITDGHRFSKTNVVVRMTSDKHGKSLSLNAGNILIEIPLEAVEDIIQVTER